MINGPIIEGELLELMRNTKHTKGISLIINEQFSASLDTIMNLAEIATQAPTLTFRMVAVAKLREINPNLQIINEGDKSYFHGWTQSNDETDIFYEIPEMKPLNLYQKSHKRY